MKANHIDIAVTGVLLDVKGGMVFPRSEFQVVPREKPHGLKVVIHQLFENVFFHGHLLGCVECSIRPQISMPESRSE
jgi:hypothetical protein